MVEEKEVWSKQINIVDILNPDELIETSSGNYKRECFFCGLQGGRTPGFIINPEKNIAFCHSSGKWFKMLEAYALKKKIITCLDGRDKGDNSRKVLEGELYTATLAEFKAEFGDEMYKKLSEDLNLNKNKPKKTAKKTASMSYNDMVEIYGEAKANALCPKEKPIDVNTKAKYLLEQEKPLYQSLGIGIINDIFYFGTKVYDGNEGMDAIVTSDKKIYIAYTDDNQIKHFGLNYRYPFLDSVLDYSWSNKSSEFSIISFLFEDEKEVSLKDCFKDCYSNNRNYMDYQDNIINISIGCSILSSYFLPIFEAKARDFFNAEKGSGKTRQSTLYDLQMFNPLMSADITGASYFRVIESTSASIIIDDFDAIEEEKKQAQIQIMRTGYKKGQKAVRVGDDKKRTPSSFNIFNSMVINNVGGLDEITQDRCNTYYLIKSNNKQKLDKKLDEKNIKWIIERDKKYYCALKEWKHVKEVYESLDIPGISGRDFERISPILTIGKIVLDNETYIRLLNYEIERIKEVKTKDVSDDWLFKSLKYLFETMVQDKKDVEIRLDVIVSKIIDIDSMNKDYVKKKHAISIFLGKIFRNTPLFKITKSHGGFVKLTVKPEALLKFLEIRDYKEFFDDKDIKVLESLVKSLPIPSIPSIQSILSIQSIPKEINGEVGEDG